MAELLDLYPEVANGVIRCIGDLHNPEVIGMAQSAGDTQLARDMVKGRAPAIARTRHRARST